MGRTDSTQHTDIASSAAVVATGARVNYERVVLGDAALRQRASLVLVSFSTQRDGNHYFCK